MERTIVTFATNAMEMEANIRFRDSYLASLLEVFAIASMEEITLGVRLELEFTSTEVLPGELIPFKEKDLDNGDVSDDDNEEGANDENNVNAGIAGNVNGEEAGDINGGAGEEENEEEEGDEDEEQGEEEEHCGDGEGPHVWEYRSTATVNLVTWITYRCSVRGCPARMVYRLEVGEVGAEAGSFEILRQHDHVH